MRAFLLAGGRGERLRPLTDSIPKCLTPINGTPLLAIWLELLRRQGIAEVLLNVSHHVDQVRAFLAATQRAPHVELVVEETPLGSAGTVMANRRFVAEEDDFWIFYADNLTDLSLGPLIETHQRHEGVMTVGLFHTPDPRAAGIVQIGPDRQVTEFEEKPVRPRGNLASAGVFLARQTLFDRMSQPQAGVFDFGLHVLPRLIGHLYGHVITDFLMDIGTPVALDRATAQWTRLGPHGAPV